MEFAPIIEKVAFNLMKYSATVLPDNAIKAIKTAYENEKSTTGKAQLGAIIKNFESGAEKSTPMCQDTGIHIYYVEIGADCPTQLMTLENLEKHLQTLQEKLLLKCQ